MEERRVNDRKVDVLNERLDNFIEGTISERQRRREYEDKLLTKVEQINDRCVRREGNGCMVFKQHILANGKEKNYKRQLWDNRLFQFGMFCAGGLLSIAVIFVTKFLNGR
jgi:hypothetical protein